MTRWEWAAAIPSRPGPGRLFTEREFGAFRLEREVLAGAGLGVLGLLFEQAFVDTALDVAAERAPWFLVEEGDDQAAQAGGVLDLVPCFLENDAVETWLLAKVFEGVQVSCSTQSQRETPSLRSRLRQFRTALTRLEAAEDIRRPSAEPLPSVRGTLRNPLAGCCAAPVSAA
ncbi:MAG: hypothetical protein HY822_09140 [Acidobacteria bacterium]|nr:hypothetical protein [Acidobacteriota bacterium]